jgi:hypothetical protein
MDQLLLAIALDLLTDRLNSTGRKYDQERDEQQKGEQNVSALRLATDAGCSRRGKFAEHTKIRGHGY